MVEIIDEEKLKYGQFVELLNSIRGEGLVSAERRRELDKRWVVEQENRDLILEEIERIMEEHSRRLMANK